MRTIVIAASMTDALRNTNTPLGTPVVTPRSQYGAHGYTADELRVTASMIDHPSLPFLLDCVRPCFATIKRETT